MSLPTITGVPPEIWEQVLQILNQFGVTVWDLTQQGITTWEGAGGLKEYLLNNGWELKEVWDLKYMWFHTGAGDVTQSNALVQYVANEVTIGGTAGAEYVKHFTYGETTLGKLKKGIIFGSIFALLVSTLDPSFITDTLKGRLNAVIDRFADDNDDVPVILDGNGKIYYHEDMINALRQELIDAGVYASGGYNPPTDFGDWTGSTATRLPWDQVHRVNGSDNSRAFVRNNSAPVYASFIRKGNSSDCEIGFASTAPFEYNVSSSSAPSRYYTAVSATVNGKTYYYSDVVLGYSTGGSRVFTPEIGAVYYNGNSISAYNLYSGYYLLYGSEGGGVEGITVSDDLISRGIGNAQTVLEDIFPSYAIDKVTTINPSDEDITASDNWYPISTEDSDVWTDGITEQQSETATDGEVTPDIQSQIADAIKQILEDYYRDPDDPNIINYPEIPVGDSGDTPPAEPPLIDAAGNGLWAIYNPTKAQVNSFGQWLWSSNIVDQITRMFNSPIDAVIGFHMVYCTPVKGSAQNIMCGFLDSGVSSITVANQYVTIDCGSVTVDEFYRTVLDYTATKLSLYLPFIGFVPLSTAVCMGSILNITYRIDVLTGTCLAQVKVIKANSEAIMYTFPGNCSVQVPLTATTYTGMVSTLVGVANTAIGVAVNSPGSVIAGAKQALEGAVESVGTGGVKQSGAIGSNAGALGIRIPYLIITHPVAYDASEYSKQYGYPLNETIVLSNLSGYTRVKDIHLQNIPCTDDELEMIERLLKDGVIIN